MAFEQIANQAQKLRLMTGGQAKVPVTYVVPGSGARSGLAGQHSDHPYPALLNLGVKTVVPATADDAYGLFVSAIRDDDPVAVFAPAAALPRRDEVPDEPFTVPLGTGRIRREGADITVVAVGHVVHDALAVADELEREGISVEVFDPRTLLPLDRKLLAVSVAKTGRIVIIDDSNRTCGYAAEVAAVLAEDLWDELRAPVVRITRADAPVPFALPLERFVLPSPGRLADAVRALAARKEGNR
jgi:acetoin:2,6-dichlorophenolindophenol oxidoreductase subunit beta